MNKLKETGFAAIEKSCDKGFGLDREEAKLLMQYCRSLEKSLKSRGRAACRRAVNSDASLLESIGKLIDAYETRRDNVVMHVAVQFPNGDYLEWNGECFVAVPIPAEPE